MKRKIPLLGKPFEEFKPEEFYQFSKSLNKPFKLEIKTRKKKVLAKEEGDQCIQNGLTEKGQQKPKE